MNRHMVAGLLILAMGMLTCSRSAAEERYGNYLPERLGKPGDESSRGILFQPDRELLYDFDGEKALEGVAFAGGRGEVSADYFMTRGKSLLWHTGQGGSLSFKAGMVLRKPLPGFATSGVDYHVNCGLFLESRNEQEPAPAFRLELEGRDGAILYQVPFYLHKAGWNILDVMPRQPDGKALTEGTLIEKIRIVRGQGPSLSVHVDSVMLVHIQGDDWNGIFTTGILAPTVYYERNQGKASEVLSADGKNAFQVIADRIVPPVALVARLDEAQIKKYEEWYAYWNIEDRGGFANGQCPLYYYGSSPGDQDRPEGIRGHHFMIQDNTRFCGELGALGSAYARCQDAGQKARLRKCLVGLVRLAVTYGGIPVASYGGRGFVDGVYYGRDALEAEGLLEPITRQVIMQYGVDRFLETPPVLDEPPCDPGIKLVSVPNGPHGEPTLRPPPWALDFIWKSHADSISTASRSALLSLLIGPDNPEKAANLKKYSTYFSRVILAYAPNARGTLKPDGSWFHHGGNRFDNYGWIGPIWAASRIFYALSNTPFRIEQEAHERLFHMGEVYQRTVHRDASYGPPDQIENGAGAAYAIFLNLARSGTPDGRQAFAPQFASAVLALKPKPGAYDESAQADLNGWIKAGILPAAPADHLVTLSYAGMQFRRLEDWSLIMRGISKHFYYCQYDRQGFLFHSIGGLDLNGMDRIHASWADGRRQWLGGRSSPSAVPRLEAGYHPSYAPCVTAVESEWGTLGQATYQKGSHAFVGGVALGRHAGIFVQPFDAAADTGTYGTTPAKALRFRKSYFTFDRQVVALGRGMGVGAGQHAFTGILQEKVSAEGPGVVLGGAGVTYDQLKQGLPSEQISWAQARDGSLGVWLFPGQQVRGDNGAMADAARPGPMTRLYLDHGNRLEKADGRYSLIYAISPQPGSMARFAEEMAGPAAPIRILRDEDALQVVADSRNGTTGYAFFGKAATRGAGPVLAADAPCLVMARLKENGKNMELSLSDPDLHMEGIGTPANYFGYSLPSTVRITMKAGWSLKQVVEVMGLKRPEVKVVSSNGEETVIQITVVDGLSAELSLEAP